MLELRDQPGDRYGRNGVAGGTAVDTVLSAGIVDVFSDEVVNAADFGGDAAPAFSPSPARCRETFAPAASRRTTAPSSA